MRLHSVSLLAAALLLACGALHAQPRLVTPRGELSMEEKANIELFRGAAPSVAYIYTETVQKRGVFRRQQVSTGTGSGFIWDLSGHVVTNNHVVDGATTVFVQLDAGKPIPATVIGTAPDYDLAVVRLKEVPAGLRPIPVGSSKDLRVGQATFAIGNPYGLSRTLTRGIVSALDRHLPTSDQREIGGVIQTDAAINPGNSGGPLLDSAGRLIGVNAAILSESGGSTGVGFSIPVDLVNRIVPELIKSGRAPRPGIGIGAADQSIAARLGVRGVIVLDIGKGSPAEAAGIVPYNMRTNTVGDIITGVNGNPVETLPSLAAEFDTAGVGNLAELTLTREGKERKVKVRIIDLTQGQAKPATAK